MIKEIRLTVLEIFLMLLQLSGLIPSHILRRTIYRLYGIKIGHNSTIHMGAKFYDPRNIVIGEGTIIGEDVVLDGREKLHIGNNVDFASEVMIYNGQHDINSTDFHATYQPVIIEDYVFIGPRAIILPGVTINKGAVVAAGAVVTKNIEAYKIVGGIPAAVIGERKSKDFTYTLGRPRKFR
jgi:acetyltransferase-like isoleucine patch superfamily enzyme